MGLDGSSGPRRDREFMMLLFFVLPSGSSVTVPGSHHRLGRICGGTIQATESRGHVTHVGGLLFGFLWRNSSPAAARFRTSEAYYGVQNSGIAETPARAAKKFRSLHAENPSVKVPASTTKAIPSPDDDPPRKPTATPAPIEVGQLKPFYL